ncbi:MAG: hypothetical protein HZA78_02160 [Candidatus Schekmanbacteria bacterium]|nr:hypothetical protein [Candidatus Schekmanbacteria bacterium]
MTKAKIFLMNLAFFFILGLTGCADIIIPEAQVMPTRSTNTPMGTQTIKITTEPDGAKIMVISMGNRKMQTFYSPAEISYVLTPAMPTVVTVAKKGFKSQNIRLDGTKEEIHVVMEKAPLSPMFDFGGAGGDMGSGGMGSGGISGAPADVPGASAQPMDSGTIVPKEQQ